MKKWVIIGLILFALIVTSASVYAYTTVRSPITDGYDQAEQTLLDSGDLETVEDISYFHGRDSYYVLRGLDADGDQAIAWIKQDFEESAILRKEAEGISAEEAEAIAVEAVNPNRIQSVKVGIEGNTPLYEIKFISESDQQGYYYVAFSDGTFLKRYNLRMD
ncbi:cell wall elongation regulator TseB-like domain-containing protein [Alkalicoccobacillus murimartini]|uniref:Uncharacterized protein YpmB n=1 Tax=Alkalicoccobacillus murimartini TaxID=171685 RepID=A0ABT9YDM6_9BACI|nr:DUF5590 domain-containing protein [Alkalicoccobacillus murimartini]MDQ0205957.1 uncharacterized protein YpmB [Alkalicoccobacillus murimartini]